MMLRPADAGRRVHGGDREHRAGARAVQLVGGEEQPAQPFGVDERRRVDREVELWREVGAGVDERTGWSCRRRRPAGGGRHRRRRWSSTSRTGRRRPRPRAPSTPCPRRHRRAAAARLPRRSTSPGRCCADVGTSGRRQQGRPGWSRTSCSRRRGPARTGRRSSRPRPAQSDVRDHDRVGAARRSIVHETGGRLTCQPFSLAVRGARRAAGATRSGVVGGVGRVEVLAAEHQLLDDVEVVAERPQVEAAAGRRR